MILSPNILISVPCTRYCVCQMKDEVISAYQPRAHWYLDFNYTQYQPLERLGYVSRDYRYEAVA